MVKKMDDPNMSGRQTPGVGGGAKPATPGPAQSSGPNPMGPNAASHGAPMRYGGYGGSPMHPGYGGGPQQMMPGQGQGPGPGQTHPAMAHPHHTPYGPGAYGQGAHQMQQQQQHQHPHPQHGGQFQGMHMMPPPSQYPNKGPLPPPPTASPQPGQQPPPPPSSSSAAMPPSAPPSPHHQQQQPPPHMMSGDRSAMSYYGQQRFGAPGGPPPPPPSSSSSGHPQPPSAYYMRPPMGGAGGGKNSYYGPGGGYGGGPQQDMRMTPQQQHQHQQQQQQHQQQMMMSGQHPSHHQHQQMMMHHHQMQQQAGYGPMGHVLGGENGRDAPPAAAAVPSSLATHTMSASAPTNQHSSSTEGHRHPQPPPIIDEVSQTSTASSQAADDSCASADMPLSSGGHKASKHHLSHPSTPNTSNLGSPGAASMSSFHDDFDSVSSPSWPRTPASPALNSSHFSSESHHHTSSKRNDGIQKLYEMSDEPERRAFLDKYMQFQEERGQPLTQVPTISKIPLDLYRLYLSVRERGGFIEVTKGKLWKECGQICNIANSSSAAYTLRKQYMKHMLHFECKFDRGGIDPGPVIQQLDATTNTKKKSAAAKAAAAAATAAATAASSNSQPRVSPPSSALESQQSATSGAHGHAGGPYGGHHPHHPHPHPHHQQQPGPYDMVEGHGGFVPPNTSVSPAGSGGGGPAGHMPPYGHPPHHPQYGHPGDYPHYLPSHTAASAGGHMPPPAPPPTSQPQHPSSAAAAAAAAAAASAAAAAAAAASGQQPPTSATTPHNESISVKDPFADDEAAASASSSSSASSSNQSSNYPPSRQPHYAMHPGGQGPYYSPMGPHAQPPPHPGAYPEGGHPSAHGQPGSHHYPAEGGTVPPYGRPPSAAPESSGPPAHSQHPHYGSAPGSGAGAYQPRMPANGHSSHGYYGQQPPPPPPPGQSPGSMPYEQSPHHPHHHHQRPPFSGAEGAHHSGRPPMAPSPHDPHYSGHPSNQPPMHRYPNSASSTIPMGYGGPRPGPYGSAPPPHPSQGQQPGPPYSSPDGFPKGAEPYNQSGPRMQSPLAQRLLAAKEAPSSASQSYPMNQPYPTSASRSSSPAMQPSSGTGKGGQAQPGSHHHGGPPPASASAATPSSSSTYQPMQQQANSNISWMPTSRYGAPKRHPDFAKPSAEQHQHQQHQQHQANFGQPPPPTSSAAGAGTAGPYQGYGQGAYQNTAQKQQQHNAPGAPWSRPGGPGGSAGPPYHPHSGSAYGGSRAAEQQAWHDSNRSPSVPPPDGHSQSASIDGSGNGRPPSNWAHNRYGAEYRNAAAMHEQFGHQRMMGGQHFGHRGPPESAGGGGNAGGGGAYLMHHHPSPGKLALSNQLAERRGVFQQSIGPPLFAAAATTVGHPPTAGQPHPHQALLRRDIIFPPNSVEATVPTPTKHRKITSREFTSLGPIDAWRLFMSLKSGLLAESTYALDVLNVYSNDDSSLSYLGLNNMPGLLEVLLEHYKCYLNEMFDNLFEDTEIGFEARQLRYELNSATRKYSAKREDAKLQTGVKRKLKWYELARDYEEEEEEENEEESEKSGSDEEEDDEDEMGLFLEKHFKSSKKSQQVVLANTTNYTHVTRNGLPVKFKRSKSLFISDYDKQWDHIKNGFAIGHEHWARGGGETTSHIVSHFEPKESRLRFVQTIKGGGGKGKTTAAKSAPETNGNSCADSAAEKVVMEAENDKPTSETTDETTERRCSTTDIGDHYPKIRPCDQERYLQSLQRPPIEDESYELEEAPLVSGGDYHESIKARVLTVSNLIRNLTFVPGNDVEMVKHPGLLLVLSRLILLHHRHVERRRPPGDLPALMNLEAIKGLDEHSLAELTRKGADAMGSETMQETEWFSDALHLLRENTLVTVANLSAHLRLAPFPEAISRPLLDGVLHWATCPSSYAADSLPSAHYSLSPRRLAFETLTKLSIAEANVDLMLATPPWARIETLLLTLVRSLGRQEEQTMREFSVVLLSNFASEPMAVRAMVALRPGTGTVYGGGLNTLSLLLGFIEGAEQSALHAVNSTGGSYQPLRETPELALGTTVDMLRRAAATLRHISRQTENRPLFVQYEARLLALAMSPVLDQSVAAIIADILYESSFVSAKRQLLLEEARALAAAQNAATAAAVAAAVTAASDAQPTTVNGDGSDATATNDASSIKESETHAMEHLDDLKKSASLATTTGQLNGEKGKEEVETGETAKSANKNASSEVADKKAVKNGPISSASSYSSDKTASKVSTSEGFEKTNNPRSEISKMAGSAKDSQSEPVAKPVETSNGFEHKSPLNASSKNHLSKNEHNNSNNNDVPTSRVSNGVLANNSAHNNNDSKDNKTETDDKSKMSQSTFFDTNSNYPQTLPSVDFFNSRTKYYTSPYPSSRGDHLLPSSGKTLSSNGLLDVEDEAAAAAANTTTIGKKSAAISVTSAASDLNSTVGGGAGTGAVPPPTAAAIIEASST